MATLEQRITALETAKPTKSPLPCGAVWELLGLDEAVEGGCIGLLMRLRTDSATEQDVHALAAVPYGAYGLSAIETAERGAEIAASWDAMYGCTA